MAKRKGDLRMLCTLILAGFPLKEAAPAAGMSPRTATRVRGSAEYVEMLETVSIERTDATVNGLRALEPRAVQTYAELLDPSVSPSIRHRAATSILTLGPTLGAQTFERRLAALEAALDDMDVVFKFIDDLFGFDEQ